MPENPDHPLAYDGAPEDIEDMIIVALVRDKHASMSSTALLSALKNEYEFPIAGFQLTAATKSLRDKGLIRRYNGTHWGICLKFLAHRPRP